jgi:hypothetical protein
MDHATLIFQHSWYSPSLSRLGSRFIRRKRRIGWIASEQAWFEVELSGREITTHAVRLVYYLHWDIARLQMSF